MLSSLGARGNIAGRSIGARKATGTSIINTSAGLMPAAGVARGRAGTVLTAIRYPCMGRRFIISSRLRATRGYGRPSISPGTLLVSAIPATSRSTLP